MKNKKLIATVASLCLVLVAVVAAVIGVLAAAQQQANTKFKVSYSAQNVYATVSLAGRQGLDSGWKEATASDVLSHTFYAQDSKEDAALYYADANAITLAQSGDNVNTYAVYRFSFKNEITDASGVSYAYLKITLKYKESSSDTYTKNVITKWFASSSDAAAFTVAYGSDTNPGQTAYASITSSTANTTAIANEAIKGTDGYVLQAALAPNGSYYAYLVVAIANLNLDALYDMDVTNNGLSITLDAAKNS